ncbi:MAG: PIN domain nuclease [Deltaproteobacteria bacterium]|nr:PIN domain nuclease [Deltaproteobacteria bacterium]
MDAGALIAFDRNNRRVRRLVELAIEHEGALHVPAGVVAQAWGDASRQARLARLVGSGRLSIRNLDVTEAKAAGVLCAASGTADVIDASVVLLARRHGAVVVTSDPDDLRRFDPTLEVAAC